MATNLKDLVEILRQGGPAETVNSAQQGFAQGQALGLRRNESDLETRKAALQKKLQDAGLLSTEELGTLPTESGVNLMPGRQVSSPIVDTMISAAAKRQAAKDAKNQKVESMSPLSNEEIEANAKAIELSGSPNAQALANAFRASAKNLSSEKGSQLGARIAGIATASGTAAGQPLRSAKGEALKNIDIPNTASAVANQIVTSYNPNYLGPVKGRMAGLKETTGLGTVSEDQSLFRSAVANLKNTDVKQFAGSAVSGSEWQRVKMQLPDENTKPAQFVARYNRAADTFNSMLDAKEKALGVDLGVTRWQKLPSTEQPSQASSAVPSVGQTFNGAKVLKVTRIQ